MIKRTRLIPKIPNSYFFILPAILIFIFIILYPIIYNFNNSFYEWGGFTQDKVFNGIENYKELVKDQYIRISLKNSFLYMLITVSLDLILGFIIAYLISQIASRYRIISSIFRAIFFLPVIVAPAFVGIIFNQIYAGQGGNLNTILRAIGLDSLTTNWIGDYNFAIYTVLLTFVWWTIGYSVVLYLAGMQAVPNDYYEAAEIDGANRFKQAIHITLPCLRSTHFTLSILGTIYAMKVFPLVMSLTAGGPSHSTDFLTIYLYRKMFYTSEISYSSTVSILLLVVALIVTIIQLRLYSRGR